MTPQARYFEWTPVLTFATPGDVAVTYSEQSGYGTKDGRFVSLFFNIVTSAFTHTTAAGNCLVTGSPFTTVNLTNFRARGAVEFGGITKATYTQVVLSMGQADANIRLFASGSGVAAALVNAADMPTGGTVQLRGSISFLAG